MSIEDNKPLKIMDLPEDQARILDALLAIRSQRGPAEADEDAPTLGPDDFEASKRIAAWLELVDQGEVADAPTDLVTRTLARVREEKLRERMMISQDRSPMGRGLPAREVLAVVAMLVVSVSMLWPAVSRTREHATRALDQNNLATAGRAISFYARDNADVMPKRRAQTGDMWWNVGKEVAPDELAESNSAHLLLTARQDYIDTDALRCATQKTVPGEQLNADGSDWASAEAVPYSYQNQYRRETTRMEQVGRMAVLANRNPLFSPRTDGQIGMRFNDHLPLDANSRAFGGAGQNVLFTDGSVTWTSSPVLESGDNIYTTDGIDRYYGTELPSTIHDTFLVP